MEQKRHRGGQPGNKNAVKHGYYAKALNGPTRSDLKKASSLEGLDEEITLLRLLIVQAARRGDYRAVKPLTKTMTVLEKLLKINNKINDHRQEKVLQAVNDLSRELYADISFAQRSAAGHDITDFNESQRIVLGEAKAPEVIGVKLASASLAGTKK